MLWRLAVACACLWTLVLGQSANPDPGGAVLFSGDSFDDFLYNDDISWPTNAFTFEAWVKTEDILGNEGCWASYAVSDLESNAFSLSDYANVQYTQGNGQGLSSTGVPNTINDGEWHHVATVWEIAGPAALYIDGVAVETTDLLQAGTPMVSGGYFVIGQEQDSLGGNFTGTPIQSFEGFIDEVRIWNTARTPEQISTVRRCSLTGEEFGLVHYWKFNEEEGEFVDSIGSDNLIISGNITRPTSDAPLAECEQYNPFLDSIWRFINDIQPIQYIYASMALVACCFMCSLYVVVAHWRDPRRYSALSWRPKSYLEWKAKKNPNITSMDITYATETSKPGKVRHIQGVSALNLPSVTSAKSHNPTLTKSAQTDPKLNPDAASIAANGSDDAWMNFHPEKSSKKKGGSTRSKGGSMRSKGGSMRSKGSLRSKGSKAGGRRLSNDFFAAAPKKSTVKGRNRAATDPGAKRKNSHTRARKNTDRVGVSNPQGGHNAGAVLAKGLPPPGPSHAKRVANVPNTMDVNANIRGLM